MGVTVPYETVGGSEVDTDRDRGGAVELEDDEAGIAPSPRSSPRASSLRMRRWRARKSAPSSGGRRVAAGARDARVRANASEARSAKIAGYRKTSVDCTRLNIEGDWTIPVRTRRVG